MSDTPEEGPPLFRPVPRRPFDFDLKSFTPPKDEDEDKDKDKDDDGDYDEAKKLQDDILLAHFRRDLLDAGFLNNPQLSPPDPAASLTRPQSILNLNSSTLAGIYKSSGTSQDHIFNDDDREELHTPWGTGAESPVKQRESISKATYELMRDRSNLPRRRSLYNSAESTPLKQRTTLAGTVFSVASRATLLFLLGAGYGILITRFHEEQRLTRLPEATGSIKLVYDEKYLAFWGFTGVALGALQPWFDRLWEGAFGPDHEEANGDALSDKKRGSETDWVLVIRAIGVFVGIAFAIRKLAWTSTMQLSATLALANPLLWWLIDRSLPGLILSAGLGLVGTIFFLGVNPQIMPVPTGTLARINSSTGSQIGLPVILGGLVNQETVETGVWMLTLLFCSCLCFGNIGRRLAWGKSKGRWGGMQ